MTKRSHREVDLDSEVGPMRVGLWADRWVIGWLRQGEEPMRELFDVFAPSAEDLVGPLLAGLSQAAAARLASAQTA